MDEGEKSLKDNLNALARKRAREVSTFAIALLMIGLVIGVGLSTPICYAPEPPYNETDAKEFDPEDLPWDNETDVIILPPPLPITNETDPVIIITDQCLASIQLQLYEIYAGMMMHDELIMNGRSSVRELNTTFNAEIADLIERYESFDIKLTTEIERKDEQIQQLDEQIELLEEELARELKSTRDSVNIISIMFGLFSVIAIGIVAMTRRP